MILFWLLFLWSSVAVPSAHAVVHYGDKAIVAPQVSCKSAVRMGRVGRVRQLGHTLVFFATDFSSLLL